MTSIYKAEDNSMHVFEGGSSIKQIIECARPHSWVDGKEYVEEKDYEVKDMRKDFGFFTAPNLQAVPLHQSNDEDELWDEAIGIIIEDAFDEIDSKLNLKSKFRITRKPSDK